MERQTALSKGKACVDAERWQFIKTFVEERNQKEEVLEEAQQVVIGDVIRTAVCGSSCFCQVIARIGRVTGKNCIHQKSVGCLSLSGEPT